MAKKITVERLEHLSSMLGKYSHRWNDSPSVRMYEWFSEYDDARNSPAWVEFCKKRGFCPTHTAADCLA